MIKSVIAAVVIAAFTAPAFAYQYKYTPSTASGGSQSQYKSNYSGYKR
jgi:hypothetical protein